MYLLTSEKSTMGKRSVKYETLDLLLQGSIPAVSRTASIATKGGGGGVLLFLLVVLLLLLLLLPVKVLLRLLLPPLLPLPLSLIHI